MGVTEAVGMLLKNRMPPMGKVPEALLDLAATFAEFRGGFGKLSKLERVLTAMRHKEPDQVPVATITCAAGRQISGISFPDYSKDPEKAAQVFLEGFDFTGGDAVILLLDLSVEACDLGQKIIYPDNSTARPDYDRPFIVSIEDYAKIRPVDVKDAPRMSNYVRLCRKVVDGIGLSAIVSGFIYGPLGVLSMMRGADLLFKDCVLHPREVKKACETVTGVLVDFADAQCKAGVGAIAIDTLFASRNALPKKLWEEMEGPFAGEIAKRIKENGVVAGIHNCGHELYFDAQIRHMEPTFISFAHLPDDCKSRKELKQKYGSGITLIGHVPTPLLIHGTPKQIMEECFRQMDDLAPGGGYILAPGCEYPPNIPLTNAIALFAAAKKYGRNYRKPGLWDKTSQTR
jgi:uroporphyrinogen decarboxylase